MKTNFDFYKNEINEILKNNDCYFKQVIALNERFDFINEDEATTTLEDFMKWCQLGLKEKTYDISELEYLLLKYYRTNRNDKFMRRKNDLIELSQFINTIDYEDKCDLEIFKFLKEGKIYRIDDILNNCRRVNK